MNELKQEDRIPKLELQLDLEDLLPLSRSRWNLHTTPLPLPRAYPVPCRHGAPDFDLQLCENALQLVKPEHIIVISAMSSI